VDVSTLTTNSRLKKWIYQQYLKKASQPDFIDNNSFARDLANVLPDKKKNIYKLVTMYGFSELAPLLHANE
jgi:hypothetical protein